MPGLFVGLGINVLFNELGWVTDWTTSGLGAQLTWTLAVRPADHVRRARPLQSRLRGSRQGSRRDSVAAHARSHAADPAARHHRRRLFGFTLSYDEFPRTVLTSGSENTLPIEIWTMTTNVTSPALYAVGTVTTVVSFVVIGTALGSIALIQRRRRASRGDPPDAPGNACMTVSRPPATAAST